MKKPSQSKSKADSLPRRTRRAVIDYLKRQGPSEAETVAQSLSLSAMAVRQHLYALSEEGLVSSQAVARPVGRPAKQWALTQAAQPLFPDSHSDLALGLILAVRESFGEAGLDKLVAVRTEQQIADYKQRLRAHKSLRKRLEGLVQIRTEEGYMAELHVDADRNYVFLENHCPICDAAKACSGICRAELTLIQQVVGEAAQVERVEHILAGARRCAYRIKPVHRNKKRS